MAAFKLSPCASPDNANDGGLPTLRAPPSVSAWAPIPSSGWLRIPRSTISAANGANFKRKFSLKYRRIIITNQYNSKLEHFPYGGSGIMPHYKQ